MTLTEDADEVSDEYYKDETDRITEVIEPAIKRGVKRAVLHERERCLAIIQSHRWRGDRSDEMMKLIESGTRWNV